MEHVLLEQVMVKIIMVVQISKHKKCVNMQTKTGAEVPAGTEIIATLPVMVFMSAPMANVFGMVIVAGPQMLDSNKNKIYVIKKSPKWGFFYFFDFLVVFLATGFFAGATGFAFDIDLYSR